MAAVSAMGKYFGRLGSSFKQRGVQGVLDEAAKYKDPVRTIRNGKPDTTINVPDIQQVWAAEHKGFKRLTNLNPLIGRGFRASIGNTADSINRITQDGALKAPGNFIRLMKDQVKADMFTEVAPLSQRQRSATQTRNNFGVGRYDIAGKTNRDSALVERHGTGKTVSFLFGANPVNFAGGHIVATSGQEHKSMKERAGEAAAVAAISSVSVPLGVAAGLVAYNRKKDQIIKEQ